MRTLGTGYVGGKGTVDKSKKPFSGTHFRALADIDYARPEIESQIFFLEILGWMDSKPNSDYVHDIKQYNLLFSVLIITMSYVHT
jgi:hypothetical protein